MFEARHYASRGKPEAGRPTGAVQVDHQIGPPGLAVSFQLDEEILRLAHREYVAQHNRQTFERLQERGGFSLIELVCLLADGLARCEEAQQTLHDRIEVLRARC